MNVRLADGSRLATSQFLSVLVDFGKITCLLKFTLLDAPCPCILGMPFLQRTNPTIDWEQRTVSFGNVSAPPAVPANIFAPLHRDQHLRDSGTKCLATVDEHVFDY